MGNQSSGDSSLKSGHAPENPNDKSAATSPMRLFLVATVIIFLAEALIMLFVGMFPKIPESYHALLDATLVTILSLPALYYYLYRPLLRQIAEREHAEGKIKDSEKELRLILDNLQDTYYRTDREGRITKASSSIEQLLGYTVDEITGKKLGGFFVEPGDREKFMQELKEGGGKITARESLLKCKNGSEVWVSTNAHYYQNENGDILGVEGTTRDVTSFKKAQEALKISERRFLDVAANTKDFIWEVNADGVYTYLSPMIEEILGYKPEELLGKNFYDFFPKSTKEEQKKVFFDKFEKRETFNDFHSTRIRKDGKKITLAITGNPIIGEEGQLLGYRGATRDITKRTKSEEMLARLATAVEQTAEGIMIADTDGNIQYVNSAFEKITGYNRQGVIGKNPRFLKSGKQSDSFYRKMWDTISSGQVWKGQFVNRKKNGQLYNEEATISPLMNANGEIISYVAIKRDVTQLLSMERQIRQSHKMQAIGTLAGGVAHDFNNILAAITGYTELALDDVSGESEASENIGEALRACARAKELVKQILTFSRQTEKEMKPVYPSRIVKESVKLIRASIPSTVEIVMNIKTETDTIMGDPTQISQVVMNLCVNAGHAMKDTGGTLGIGLESIYVDGDTASSKGQELDAGDYLLLTVSDTGHGMDKDIMDQIFDPFFTTKEVGEGTGLGLSAIHGIVSSHGGAITVSSKPGAGTIFNIYFPMVKVDVETETKNAKPIPGGNELILFVDDESMIVDMNKKSLERLGYDVIARTSPSEALEAFRIHPDRFDLVITDQSMPKMTGAQLAEELTRIRADIPVIIATGYSDTLSEKAAKKLGFCEYLAKPVPMKKMAETIRNVLDNGHKN